MLLFSIMVLLSYKGFFGTRLQGLLSPSKSSFSSSSDQHQQVLQKVKLNNVSPTMTLYKPSMTSFSGHANLLTSLKSYWRALKSAWSSGRPGCGQNFLLALHRLYSAQYLLVIRKEFSILANKYDNFNNFATSPQNWKPALIIANIIVFSLNSNDWFCTTDIQTSLRIHPPKSAPVFGTHMARFHPPPTQ